MGVTPVQKMQGSIHLVFLLYFWLPAPLGSRSTEQHMLALARGRASEALELQAVAPWNWQHSALCGSASASRHCSSCKKHRSKFKFIAKCRDPIWGELLARKWRGKPFTAERGAPAAEVNAPSSCPEIIGLGPPVTSAEFTAPTLSSRAGSLWQSWQ